MASSRQNDQFRSFLIPDELLDNSIEWIADNMEPEDVFGEARLTQWAEANGYKKED